jgi:hypothetical protein
MMIFSGARCSRRRRRRAENENPQRTYNLFSSHFITKDKRLLPVLTHSAAQPLTRFAREQKRPFFDAAAFLRRDAYILFTSSRLKNNYAPTVVLAPRDWISHFCRLCVRPLIHSRTAAPASHQKRECHQVFTQQLITRTGAE